ncbi:MAG: HesA/MoeB/ThiF family protein [Bacteroidales bacterium]|nr:HesA/MoeB/ThiF family protein [Bacteroidales bacterium]
MEGDSLSPRELRRYKKQIMIPEIGIEGQQKLKNAAVLVVGAGGLGCPVLQYLVSSGVGKVAIVEFDLVDETNLQRQVLYGSNDVGKLKSIIAKNRLEHLNPLIEVVIINLRLDSTNSLRILKDYDIIVDATDNLETRYLINDSCVILGKPMVHGAIYKFEGQVSVFNYRGGPTYRCYNPQAVSGQHRNPQAADVGVTGVLPGITGTFMANEVIKIIAGLEGILSGKMLVFNILNISFRLVSIKNIPGNHNITEPGAY